MEKKKTDNRRKHERVPFVNDVEMEGVKNVRCSELSIGGMYIEAGVVFPEGTTVDLRFKLADTDKQPIKVKALVMYVHDGLGMGVAFSNLTVKDRKKIQKFIKQR